MRISVHLDGSVVVTTPYSLRENVAERFLREKMDWILAKLAFFKQFDAPKSQGGLRGQHVRLGRSDYLKHKDSAFALVQQKAEYFAQQYACKYNRISIKDQKTCWGSCSQKANLNFNYKIIFLPENIQNYIVVHELCHLKQLNHSKIFWSLVAQTISNYKEIKKELRKTGVSFY
ncbi:MAG: M48 family metallopeptidase [Candidatus Spechtbacteria bacterium]|nr:M48 family metallopeptidase [Candidatus Spechtbacteria bacterium]